MIRGFPSRPAQALLAPVSAVGAILPHCGHISSTEWQHRAENTCETSALGRIGGFRGCFVCVIVTIVKAIHSGRGAVVDVGRTNSRVLGVGL